MRVIISFVLAVFCMGAAIGQTTELSNELIWNTGEFFSGGVSGFRSMNDGIHYTRLEREEGMSRVVKYRFETGEQVQVLLDAANLKLDDEPVNFQTYAFTADETSVLLGTDIESIYRRSSQGHYYIYSLVDKRLSPLADFDGGKQIHPELSPDGKTVSFIRDNDIYLRDMRSGSSRAITTDGKVNEVINGMCDWVYEEEFSFTKAYEWSPSGQYIAYLRFDERVVPTFNITYYNKLYPEQYAFKYPKAGEANSTVSVHIYNVATGETRKVNTGDEADVYFPRIQWVGEDQLVFMKMNRHQNNLEMFTTSFVEANAPERFHKEVSDTYVDLEWTQLFFLEKTPGFIITSEKNGFNQLYHYSSNGKLLRQITKGKWDVTEVYGVDEEAGVIYFQAAKNSAIDKGIYSVKLNGRGLQALTEETGSNSAQFTSTFAFFLNYHNTANTPQRIALYDNEGNEVRVLEDNAELRGRLEKYALGKKEFLKIPTDFGYLNAWMLKPADFDETIRYPVLMYVYNGPGRNTVLNSWGGHTFMWHQYLAQQGYIVVSVDGRGTNFRGVNFKKSTYLQLGKLETEDQITAAGYLADLPFIDGSRIGIQGWSYGGYMAGLCMTKGADVFKAGIAVAPVTNWRYYDTIYTERFMRTPQENPDGYDDNSPINHVEKLKGPFLLVHGGADDNVHPQNTMEMINALVAVDVQFDLFIYPNKNHGIYGGNTRKHLFDKMSDFIFENL